MGTEYNYDDKVLAALRRENGDTDEIPGSIFPLLHSHHLWSRGPSSDLFPPQTEQRSVD